MNTTNLISTPNIEGNISSCTTNVTQVETGRNLFIADIMTITTNNCTGLTNQYNTWKFTDDFQGLSAFIVGIIMFSFLLKKLK